MYKWLLISVLGFVANAALAADWEVIKFHNRDYISLRSFCKFYKFPDKTVEPTSSTEFLGPYGTIVLRLESRESYINGIKCVLSFPLIQQDGLVYLSRVDLVTYFEPLLRPNSVKNKIAVTTVILDAGHGGHDNGAIGKFGIEKKHSLDVAFKVKRRLEAANLNVKMTRNGDYYPSLGDRVAMCSGRSSTIFTSIHFNQGQSKASGIETFCLTPQAAPSSDSERLRMSDMDRNPGNKTDPHNSILAASIQRALIQTTGATDRGVKRARFWVIKYNTIPAVLVECGFVSNSAEGKKIRQESYRELLAEGIAQGILRYKSYMEGKTVSDIKPQPVSRPVVPAVTNAPTPVSIPTGVSTNLAPVTKPKFIPEVKPSPAPPRNPAPSPTTNLPKSVPGTPNSLSTFTNSSPVNQPRIDSQDVPIRLAPGANPSSLTEPKAPLFDPAPSIVRPSTNIISRPLNGDTAAETNSASGPVIEVNPSGEKKDP